MGDVEVREIGEGGEVREGVVVEAGEVREVEFFKLWAVFGDGFNNGGGGEGGC